MSILTVKTLSERLAGSVLTYIPSFNKICDLKSPDSTSRCCQTIIFMTVIAEMRCETVSCLFYRRHVWSSGNVQGA